MDLSPDQKSKLYGILKNFGTMNKGLDTEHCHFLNVPKDKLIEVDMLNVGTTIARTGDYMLD